MIAAAVRALLTWFGGGLVALFGSWKGAVFFIVVTCLGIVLYNVLEGLFVELLNFSTSKMASATTGANLTYTYNFADFAGYMMSCFRIPECVSFIVSMLMLKWTLRKIPFIKW